MREYTSEEPASKSIQVPTCHAPSLYQQATTLLHLIVFQFTTVCDFQNTTWCTTLGTHGFDLLDNVFPFKNFTKDNVAAVNHEVFTVVMKNWDPFVFGPEFAMDNTYGPVCFNLKFFVVNFAVDTFSTNASAVGEVTTLDHGAE